jgi:hypothetical protein
MGGGALILCSKMLSKGLVRKIISADEFTEGPERLVDGAVRHAMEPRMKRYVLIDIGTDPVRVLFRYFFAHARFYEPHRPVNVLIVDGKPHGLPAMKPEDPKDRATFAEACEKR